MSEENITNAIETKLVPSVDKKILMIIIGLVLPTLFAWALFTLWNTGLVAKLFFSFFFIISILISIFGIRMAFSVYVLFADNIGLVYYNSFTKKTISISELCGYSKTENGILVFYKKSTDTKVTLPYASFSNYFKDLNLLTDWISKHSLVSEPMDENQFWEIISLSLENSENYDEQIDFIVNKLTEEPFKSIVGFVMRIDSLLYQSYNERLWCSAYLINNGSSDDDFEYFRLWLISRGKEVFYSALNNPDSIIDFIPEDFDPDSGLECEDLWYAADKVFNDNITIDDYIDYDEFTQNESNYPQIEFTWNEAKPETIKAICPKLYEKKWN